MDGEHDRNLSKALASRIAQAKAQLLAGMAERGLSPAAGWRITEKLRTGVGRTEFVFRPTHLRHESPDLETSVAIDDAGRLV